MTATNHALAGALIAMAVKKPEFAVPLAFLSHFALDAIPHYNPPKLTRENFKNYADSYHKKFGDKYFRIIFPTDMVLFILTLAVAPLVAPSSVSSVTVFVSALAGAAPDFDGGLRFLSRYLKLTPEKSKDRHWFALFHSWWGWMERPWGIYVELVWLMCVVWSISKLIR